MPSVASLPFEQLQLDLKDPWVQRAQLGRIG